jgi:hypothetical protein
VPRIATTCMSDLCVPNCLQQAASDPARYRYRYIGLGALGLGGLYMMMRRQSTKGPSNVAQPGDLVGPKSAEKSMDRMLGRGR